MGVCRVAEGDGTICSAREGPSAGRSSPSSSQRDREDGEREDRDSSYRLPLAAPCSRRPLHHHSIALYTQSRERGGGEQGGQGCCLPFHCPSPQGLTLSPLGPGAPRSPCEEGEMLQGCTAGSGQHLPIPRGASFSPQLLGPQSPLPCPHAPPGSQASPVGEKRGVVRKGPRSGCSWGRGVLTAGPRSPSGPGRPSSPCKKERM